MSRSSRNCSADLPELTAVRLLEELRRRGFHRQIYRGPPAAQRAAAPLGAAPGGPLRDGAGRPGPDGLRRLRPRLHQEGRRRVSLFSYILGYSRRQYLRFVESQDLTSTLREHLRAFEHLGGVAATCFYDNMKVVVTRYEGDVPVYNSRFLAFATHYGYRPVACRPGGHKRRGRWNAPFLCRNQLARRPHFAPSSISTRYRVVAGRSGRRARAARRSSPLWTCMPRNCPI